MTKIKLWYIRDSYSGGARLYSKLPKARHPVAADKIFLPVSIIEGTTRYPAEGEEWPVHIVTLPDWLAEKHNL